MAADVVVHGASQRGGRQVETADSHRPPSPLQLNQEQWLVERLFGKQGQARWWDEVCLDRRLVFAVVASDDGRRQTPAAGTQPGGAAYGGELSFANPCS